MSKLLKDWTFDELVIHMAWYIMEALLRGTPIKTAIHTVCDQAARWNAEQKK